MYGLYDNLDSGDANHDIKKPLIKLICRVLYMETKISTQMTRILTNIIILDGQPRDATGVCMQPMLINHVIVINVHGTI